MSVVRNLEVVRYSGAAIALHIIYGVSVGARSSVHYWVEVRYLECPLIESTYTRVHCNENDNIFFIETLLLEDRMYLICY